MRRKTAGLLLALVAAGCEVETEWETSTRVGVGKAASAAAEPDTFASTIPLPPPAAPPALPPSHALPPAGSGCDPNYDPCVPIASDVDCAGGSGNDPEYVDGPVRVTGRDVYGLDRDGDGIACDR
jgi:hypothetical protein